jgi:hypothetical protein
MVITKSSIIDIEIIFAPKKEWEDEANNRQQR